MWRERKKLHQTLTIKFNAYTARIHQRRGKQQRQPPRKTRHAAYHLRFWYFPLDIVSSSPCVCVCHTHHIMCMDEKIFTCLTAVEWRIDTEWKFIALFFCQPLAYEAKRHWDHYEILPEWTYHHTSYATSNINVIVYTWKHEIGIKVLHICLTKWLHTLTSGGFKEWLFAFHIPPHNNVHTYRMRGNSSRMSHTHLYRFRRSVYNDY